MNLTFKPKIALFARNLEKNDSIKKFLLLFVFVVNLISCKITDCTRSISIEIMNPVVSSLPENVKTVAILNRAIIDNDSLTLYNFGRGNLPCDITLNKFELSNYCIDGLTSFFEQEAYFQKVINYTVNDSMINFPEGSYKSYKSSDLFDISGADALIFLDFLQFENEVSVFYDATYRTRAALSWSIVFRDDTPSNIYNQIDTLFFNKSQYEDILHKNQNKRPIYQDAARYLGKRFGTKIIPSWISDERYYYHSFHPEMIKAEKYVNNYEWLNAGAIWNKQSKNKNQKIAAKACFNMALACEMEGKYDLAIGWLIDSNNILTKNNFEHRANCQHYMRFLTLRKYEVERLEKQIRN